MNMENDSAATVTIANEIQQDPFGPPENKTCASCQERPATLWWVGDGGTLAITHGMKVPWCERCCVSAQLKHARERAAEIPALEAKLKELEKS